MAKHELWVDKYQPTKLSEYVFHDDTHRETISKWIANKTIPNVLLTGVQGTGKTTLAHILCSEIGVDPFDVLLIEASDENSIDVMRDKIKGFISTFALGSTHKIVILDEADYISQPGQAILRHLIGNNSDHVRFILTCNYENRLSPPLKSRLQQLRFKAPNVDDVTTIAATILIKEDVTFDLPTLDTYVAVGYPDIRSIIQLLERNTTTDRKLSPPSTTVGDGCGDIKFELLDLIESDNWIKARELVCGAVTGEEWSEMYTFLYNNIHKSVKFQNQDHWDQAMIHIAEHAYKHEMVAAPEINMAALLIKLTMI